jgi:mono/diheme cytochrome c family protein
MLGRALLLVLLVAGCGAGGSYESADIERGGRLYDTFWKVPGVKVSTEPLDTNPTYKTTKGKQVGSVTWRCKECHGWDYRGFQGAYGIGDHATGVIGLYGDSQAQTPEWLFMAIRDGVPGTAMAAYGELLSGQDIQDLVKFIKEGLIDMAPFIDPVTRRTRAAIAANGSTLYEGTCAVGPCHGSNGKALNFGTPSLPEFLGSVANDNPWEFMHKVRAGQPGTEMPSAIADTKWTLRDLADVMAHAQTLPTE